MIDLAKCEQHHRGHPTPKDYCLTTRCKKLKTKTKKFAKLKMARQVVGGGNQIQWNLNSGNQKYILHEHHVHPKVCYSQGWTIHCDSILILSL